MNKYLSILFVCVLIALGAAQGHSKGKGHLRKSIPSPVAYFPLDSGLLSEIVNGYDLNTNQNVTTASGRVGLCATGASNDYNFLATVPEDVGFIGDGSYTVSLWEKHEADEYTASVSVIRRQSDGETVFLSIDRRGPIWWLIGSDQSYPEVNAQNDDLSNGTWRRWTVVYDAPGGSMTIYLNGAYYAGTTGVVTSNLCSTSDYPELEFRVSYLGFLDEVKVWNQALTQAQVAAEYASY